MPFNFTPKYGVVLYIPSESSLQVFFSRNVDKGVTDELMQISTSDGFSITQPQPSQLNKPYSITFPPTFEVKDIGLEVERMLRRRGINDLCIKIESGGISQKLLTLDTPAQGAPNL